MFGGLVKERQRFKHHYLVGYMTIDHGAKKIMNGSSGGGSYIPNIQAFNLLYSLRSTLDEGSSPQMDLIYQTMVQYIIQTLITGYDGDLYLL